jgi:hypothetical protein
MTIFLFINYLNKNKINNLKATTAAKLAASNIKEQYKIF